VDAWVGWVRFEVGSEGLGKSAGEEEGALGEDGGGDGDLPDLGSEPWSVSVLGLLWSRCWKSGLGYLSRARSPAS